MQAYWVHDDTSDDCSNMDGFHIIHGPAETTTGDNDEGVINGQTDAFSANLGCLPNTH